MKSIHISSLVLVLPVLLMGCGPSDKELSLEADNNKLRYERDLTKKRADTLESKLTVLAEQFDSSKKNVEALESRVGDFNVLKESSKKSMQLVASLRSEVETLETELVTHKEKLTELDTRATKLSMLQQETEQQKLKAEEIIENNTRTISELKTANAELLVANESNLNKLSELSSLENVMKAQLADQNDEMARLTKKLKESEKELQVFKDEKDNLSKTVSQTVEQLSDVRARAANLNKDYKAMLGKHAQLSRVSADNKQSLNNMRTTLETAQKEVARLTDARGIYTIQKGDSLSSIASFFYRDGNRWRNIWQANQYMLPKSDLIYEGMVLIVPKIEQ